ncbi:hypothetical protein LTR84_003574 [Exophiala bonariae]|uniref:Major facilitator superfamily (MFS) profile domain-containing protein n=1 Tax=Exophiala bonariae TaxID=1690606 RepID=A0AAV9N795_9EURO|nr:hypothetical protein LTR84_003574 [Exophiala bonariae]
MSMGYTSVSAQVMSIPIFAVAGVLSVSTGLLADRLKHRFGFAMLGCLITTVGFAILLSMMSVPVGARYFALFAITSGSYITLPITIVWLSNNLAGHYKRAVGSAMQLGIGNAGGIIAGNIFLPKQAPTYPVGFGVGLACVWLCGLSCAAMLFILMRENKLRETGQRDYRLQESADEVRNMGDDHPSFRFTY